jgi:cytochrome c553
MGKYKISPNVTKSYLADFHGTTVRLSRKSSDPEIGSYKAVCYDCHGIHDIKKVKDPSSSVVKENLAKTCARCHEGAGKNFPAAWTAHYEPDKTKWPIVYWVNVFYKLAIPGILGGFGLYIGLELFHALKTRLQRRRQG